MITLVFLVVLVYLCFEIYLLKKIVNESVKVNQIHQEKIDAEKKEIRRLKNQKDKEWTFDGPIT
jgi:hypothetical protein